LKTRRALPPCCAPIGTLPRYLSYKILCPSRWCHVGRYTACRLQAALLQLYSMPVPQQKIYAPKARGDMACYNVYFGLRSPCHDTHPFPLSRFRRNMEVRYLAVGCIFHFIFLFSRHFNTSNSLPLMHSIGCTCTQRDYSIQVISC
jgi:hypothetical protein